MSNFHVVAVVLLLACAATAINPLSLFGGSSSKPMPVANVKGRLLTPQEGCGYSRVQHKRIVGGSTAKPGECENARRSQKKSNFFPII